MAKDFNYALVWGLSAKHNPQRCGLSHELEDEDVIQVGCAAITIASGLEFTALCVVILRS